MLKFFSKPLERDRGLPGRLLQDDRGVTAVEFGLLAVPFFTIVAGILQTSVIFLATQVLESAVQDASRLIRTGQVQTAGRDIEYFRGRICDRLFSLFPDCSGLHVRVNEVSFRNMNIDPPVDPECTSSCEWSSSEVWSPGPGKTTMMVQVYYRYPVLLQFGPLGMANLADGTRLLGTATVFENEPF